MSDKTLEVASEKALEFKIDGPPVPGRNVVINRIDGRRIDGRDCSSLEFLIYFESIQSQLRLAVEALKAIAPQEKCPEPMPNSLYRKMAEETAQEALSKINQLAGK